MQSKCVSIEIRISDQADKLIQELFQLLLSIYQIGLVRTMKGSSFIFDHVHLLYYKFHKINLNYGGSYINSSYWIKNKNGTINLINKNDDKCFK